MKRYKLNKYIFNLADSKAVEYLRNKFINYHALHIEGTDCALLYFNDNLVFSKRNRKEGKMFIILVHASKKLIRQFWRNYNLRRLSQHFTSLFYKQKTILL